MRRNHQHDGPRRNLRPGIEGLEARDLPSATPISMAPFPDPAVIANSINLLYGANSKTPRTPTPVEVKRETFISRWVGTYVIGPPRFSDRASTIHFFSKDGGSNQFLSGKMQMVLDPPADPNATPDPGDPFANQVTGIAALFPGNFLQSGGIAALDVSGPTTPGSDPSTLPTHLSWTFDANSSAGPYTAPALDFNQGQGVVDIRYIPDKHPRPGSMGTGKAIVTFQGVLNLSQIIATTSKPYS